MLTLFSALFAISLLFIVTEIARSPQISDQRISNRQLSESLRSSRPSLRKSNGQQQRSKVGI
ncbi:hypothetical protein CGZ80_15670 [Rhodopirellula sp. MGV]|nr:hypothetical protein CGZ80_15670 [Rhodopirellula sp. MGV]PNY35034.1 hypothetical protein C2E31_20190 [Rhodopirellula baltica]